MAIKRMTFSDLKDLFYEHNKANLNPPLVGYIVFTEGTWIDHVYSLESRTYEVSSDNKAFRPNCCSISLYGNCMDGTDQDVRLDWYMYGANGHDGWAVDYCYVKENEE